MYLTKVFIKHSVLYALFIFIIAFLKESLRCELMTHPDSVCTLMGSTYLSTVKLMLYTAPIFVVVAYSFFKYNLYLLRHYLFSAMMLPTIIYIKNMIDAFEMGVISMPLIGGVFVLFSVVYYLIDKKIIIKKPEVDASAE